MHAGVSAAAARGTEAGENCMRECGSGDSCEAFVVKGACCGCCPANLRSVVTTIMAAVWAYEAATAKPAWRATCIFSVFMKLHLV